MGMKSQRKGAQGERELASLLSACGFPALRTCQERGGLDTPDVLGSGLEAFHVEVKRTERLDLPGALAQAARDSLGRRIPLIFHRRNRTPWLAVLPAGALLAILSTLRRAGGDPAGPAGGAPAIGSAWAAVKARPRPANSDAAGQGWLDLATGDDGPQAAQAPA